MKVVVRADASVAVGSGHVVRCATLAARLVSRGADVMFVCRLDEGNLVSWLEASRRIPVAAIPATAQEDVDGRGPGDEPFPPGFRWDVDLARTMEAVGSRSGPADWLVVDHYRLGREWESGMRPFAHRIMAIDDLADRVHDCDLLLDQNHHENLESRYDGLVPATCRTFLGPRFALLRDEFLEARKRLRGRDGTVRRILIFFGGSDPGNETGKALDGFLSLGERDIEVDVVVGKANPNRDALARRCAAVPNAVFHCQVDYMADLMSRADLALGAGGTAAWERCCLGLPTAAVTVARNQEEVTASVAAAGAAWYLGRAGDVDADAWAGAVRRAIGSPQLLLRMGERACALMGGESFDGGWAVVRAIMGEDDAAT